jgi:3-phosphoshikimate 1-carboxyvinyltransferase
MRSIHVNSKKNICGTFSVPGDKSISHRAVIFSSLATGKSIFDNFLNAADCLSTVNAFRALGVPISVEGEHLEVSGKGLHGLAAPHSRIDCGNSGTTMRLITGILAAQSFQTVLIGDESLQSRPMSRIIDPLSLMGASIRACGPKNTAPLEITGQPLQGIEFLETRGSAQVKSAVLLAALYAKGKTVLHEQRRSRDHTERMLMLFCDQFKKNGSVLSLCDVTRLNPQENFIPGDISSAAFFIVAALILKDSEIVIERVGLNPTRTGVISVLNKMGAGIKTHIDQDGYEPIGTVRVRSADLRGITIDHESIPFVIDELPVLMVAAACAEGRTVITGASELRVKETDRIASMAAGLQTCGVSVSQTDDGIIIDGTESFRDSITVDSCNDHRTAMSFAVLALKTKNGITINNSDCVDISFPTFFKALDLLTH